MSSKKRKGKNDKNDKKTDKKHPGGPLQRTGPSAESWNEGVGTSLELIPLTHLPTKRTVLRRYRYLRLRNDTATTTELINIICNEVRYIWDCAHIPLCPVQSCFNQVKSVIELWQNILKFPPAKRLDREFQDKFDQLLDIAEKPKGRYSEEKAHRYLNKAMREKGKSKATGFEFDVGDQDWTDDMKFYLDQKGPRLRHMEGVDGKLTKKEKKLQHRAIESASKSSTTNETVPVVQTVTADTYGDDDETDTDYSPALKRKATESINLQLPPDAMRQLAPLAYRLKLSTRQQTAFTAGLIKVGGGNLKDTTLSVASTHRQRHEGINIKSSFIKKSFIANIPTRMVLHWDGKVIKYEKKKEKDDRLCIIGSFPGILEDDKKKPDLFFGAPLLEKGSGLVCAQKLVNVVTEWKIPESIIIGTSWDTTYTNSGHKSGAATLFEARFMRALLWLACRHHIGELHVKHPDIKIRILSTTAPEDTMFKNFQKIYKTLPPSNFRLYQWPDNLVHPMDFLTTHALETLRWAEDMMVEGTFSNQRDDYREFCELIVVYLGGRLTRKRKNGTLSYPEFRMRYPGAFTYARFLAKSLYLIKMSMMLDVIPEEIIPAEKRNSVDQMVLFIVLFHARYFLQAFLPAAAPRLDLQYWCDMREYSKFDEEVANEVLLSILRQLWYLTEELCILSLFDKGLPFEIRNDIARALLSNPRPVFFPPGKPQFPEKARLMNNPELKDFVGPRSWLLFHLLHVSDPEWLNLPADTWESDNGYLAMNEIVMDLPVTNDTAERAVKKVTDYADSAEDGGKRGKIVSVAAWHHTKMSGYTKDDLENTV